MILSLEQAVLTELGSEGPVCGELRRLARDRVGRALVALLAFGEGRMGSRRLRLVAAHLAAVLREEHAAGVRVR